MRDTLLICSGEPAGVGPDLCLMLPAAVRRRALVIGDADMLKSRARQLKIDLNVVDSNEQPQENELRVHHLALRTRVRSGRPDRRGLCAADDPDRLRHHPSGLYRLNNCSLR